MTMMRDDSSDGANHCLSKTEGCQGDEDCRYDRRRRRTSRVVSLFRATVDATDQPP